MAIISEKWKFEDDGKLYCWWQNYKSDKTRENALRNHSEIGPENGSMCDIIIKYKTESYDKAKKKLKLLEISSDIETADEDRKSRRKNLKMSRFEDFMCSEDSAESDEFPVVPRLTLKLTNRQDKYETESKAHNTEESQHSMILPSLEQNMRDTGENGETCKNCLHNNDEVLLKIYRNLEKYNADINERLNYLTGLIQQISVTNNVTENANLDVSLPFNTVDELHTINTDLDDENIYYKYLNVLKLVGVGGKDCPETTRRVMAKAIGHDLALRINWTGRNGKPRFHLFKNVIKLITDAVMSNPLCKGSFTTSCVETTMKSWLRGATDREGGRNTRKKNIENPIPNVDM